MNAFKSGRVGILLTAILALVAVSVPSAAVAKDRNGDRIPDRWEKRHKLTLKVDQRKMDQDRDGLRNRGEWLSQTNPRDRDSDDDGISDSREKAGVISAYDAEAGTLTLTLYAGGEITGAVTDRTRVKCEDESDDSTEPAPEAGVSGSDRSGPNRGREDSSDDEAEDESEDSSDDSEESEDEGHSHGRGNDGDCDGACSVADLAEGVEVLEARISLSAEGIVFRKIEIEKPVAAG
jgi:hypothetical protein